MRGEDGIRFFTKQKEVTERWPEPGRQGPLEPGLPRQQLASSPQRDPAARLSPRTDGGVSIPACGRSALGRGIATDRVAAPGSGLTRILADAYHR